MVDADGELREPQATEHCIDHRQHLGLDGHRAAPDAIDVALVEFAIASPLRPIGAPDGLNLIAPKRQRQVVQMRRDHPRERHGQVIAQRHIGQLACEQAGRALALRQRHHRARRRFQLVAALEDAEQQTVAFFAVLALQYAGQFHRGRLQRLEAIALEGIAQQREGAVAQDEVTRQEIARAFGKRGRRFGHRILLSVVARARMTGALADSCAVRRRDRILGARYLARQRANPFRISHRTAAAPQRPAFSIAGSQARRLAWPASAAHRAEPGADRTHKFVGRLLLW